MFSFFLQQDDRTFQINLGQLKPGAEVKTSIVHISADLPTEQPQPKDILNTASTPLTVDGSQEKIVPVQSPSHRLKTEISDSTDNSRGSSFSPQKAEKAFDKHSPAPKHIAFFGVEDKTGRGFKFYQISTLSLLKLISYLELNKRACLMCNKHNMSKI
jgi:hypothetical protein